MTVDRVFANPFYAIEIDPSLAEAHEPFVPRDVWVETNAMLITEMGARAYLYLLLSILEGDYVPSEIRRGPRPVESA